MAKKKEPPPFVPGDRVVTEFHDKEAHIVRTVLECHKSDRYESGWAVTVDSGKPCDHCGRSYSHIPTVDSGWFKKAKKNAKAKSAHS